MATNKCPELCFVFDKEGRYSYPKCKAVEEGDISRCPKAINAGNIRQRCWQVKRE